MKKTFFIFLLALLFQVSAWAQFPVTKFLGIPVDGTKAEMIKKLEAKGFVYHQEYQNLSGEFNGVNVNAYIKTYKNKIWRIMVVYDNAYSESDVRSQYNHLVYQFKNSKRYDNFDKNDEFYIGQDVNLYDEIHQKKKQISAMFFQKDKPVEEYDIDKLLEIANEHFGNKYTKEQMEDYNVPKDDLLDYIGTAYTDALLKRQVWITITPFENKYLLSIFYDNVKNQSHGEDL